jgi:hypothetical protein
MGLRNKWKKSESVSRIFEGVQLYPRYSVPQGIVK